MLLLAFAILLLSAALCFGIGRAAPSRLIGIGAAATSLVAATLVALAPEPGPTAAPLTLLELGAVSFSLSAGIERGARAIAVALLGGGGAALLTLAGAIAAPVRGFGAVFAWALVTLAAALLSLAAPPLSLAQPLAWAALTIGGYSSLRASGAAVADEAPPLGLTFGLLASALLLGGLLPAAAPLRAGALPLWPAALCGLLATLALAGCPPLAGVRADAVEAPAPLASLLYGLAAPAAGLGWLLRIIAALPSLPDSWSATLGLIGGLGVLACGAGALGARRLRPLLAWTTAGQASAVVAAAGLGGPLAALAGPGMLLALMLSDVVGAGAAETLDRTTGSDDYTVTGAAPPRIVGVGWALAAAGSLGLPFLWGLWPRLWLLQTAKAEQPWLLAPLLAGSALATLALLVPLPRLWGSEAPADRAGWADLAPALIAGLPALALGVAPGLAWAFWLQAVPQAPDELPVSDAALIASIGAGLTLLALAILLARAAPSRSLERDPDEDPVYLGPDALGSLVRPLAWLGHPAPLLQGVWVALTRASAAARFMISLFEQRYYLLGVLAALITIMLLMTQ